MVERERELTILLGLLRRFPVVGIIGARQVGKTTLARMLSERLGRPTHLYDLENPEDLARLAEPMLVLQRLKGLVIIDEVQRHPDLFPVLRVLADRPQRPCRFLVLGSASPDLLRQTSETLAGRIAYHRLGGFALDEIGSPNHLKLWRRGGLPRSYLAVSEAVKLRMAPRVPRDVSRTRSAPARHHHQRPGRLQQRPGQLPGCGCRSTDR